MEIQRGELFFEATVRAGTDSNVFGNAAELDDTLITLEPTLVYSRRAGRLNVDARAGVTVNEFSDFDSEDITDRFVRIDLTVPTALGSPLTGNLYVDYFDGRRIDLYLSDRIGLDAFSIGTRNSYHISPKADFRFGGDFLVNSPDGLPDNDTWSLVVGAGYIPRPKMTAFLDYRYRRSSSDPAPGTLLEVGHKDHAVFAGVSGDLSPVVSGVFSAGFQSTRADAADAFGDSDRFVADVSLTWQARIRTKVKVIASADSAVTNDARTVDRKAISLGIEQMVARTFKAHGEVRWETYDFRETPSRTDDQFSASVRLVYEARKFLSSGIEFTFWDRNPEGSPGFDRTTINIFSTFRY